MTVNVVSYRDSDRFAAGFDRVVIRQCQIEQLFTLARGSLNWSFVVVAMLTTLLWNAVPQGQLLSWMTAVLIVTIPRIILIKQFFRRKPHHSHYSRWLKAFLIGTIVSGMVWGLLVLLFIPTESPGYDFIILVTLLGITCTALTSYSAIRAAHLCFLIPVMVQVIISFLLQGGKWNLVMPIFVLLYSFILIEAGNRLYRFNLESLRKRFENKELMQLIRDSEEKFRALSEASFEAIFLSEDGICLEQNLSAQRMFGYSDTEAVGMETVLWVSPEYRDEVKQKIEAGLENPYEIIAMRRDGTTFPCEIRGKMIPFSGRKVRVTGLRDITERKRFEDRIKHMANHDVLTNLPTLRLARDRIRMALEISHRSQALAVVMYLDLDNFKQVNDTYGHSCGDNLLKDVARRFSRCVRKTDTLARIGGDEFLIVLANQQGLEGATQVARKLVESLSEPVILDESRVQITVSIGIAHFPCHGDNPDQLIKKADETMYLRKNSGKNGYTFADTATVVR